MQKVIARFQPFFASDAVQCMSILANTMFGFAFGRMLMLPAPELSDSLLIKGLLVAGMCLLASVALRLHRTCRGVIRNCRGCVRPVVKESLMCGGLAAGMMVVAVATYFLKVAL